MTPYIKKWPGQSINLLPDAQPPTKSITIIDPPNRWEDTQPGTCGFLKLSGISISTGPVKQLRGLSPITISAKSREDHCRKSKGRMTRRGEKSRSEPEPACRKSFEIELSRYNRWPWTKRNREHLRPGGVAYLSKPLPVHTQHAVEQ